MLYQYVVEAVMPDDKAHMDLYVSNTAYRSRQQCDSDAALMIEEMQRNQDARLTYRVRLLNVR